MKNIFKKNATVIQPEGRIEFFKKKYKQEQEKKTKTIYKKQRLKDYIQRAGLQIDTKRLHRLFFNAAIGINLAISAFLMYHFSVAYGITWGTVVASMIVLWIFIFILLIIAMWIIFYVVIDLKIFKRKIDIEDVLPDFLQLAASNINSGMTIDKALWYAVRPRFGVLAKEIENIAKETMSGADLKIALEQFAARYDSLVLKRTISMINEGIEAGGEIGNLLYRVSLDIQEQRAILKEMSANVTTYVIFITFATIVAAPFLFALSGVLIAVVDKLGSALGNTANAAVGMSIPLSFSGTGVTQSDFRIFVIVSLISTSLFSAMMTSTIKKGNIQSGVKYIPIFISVSLAIYFIAQIIVGKLISIFI